ncbi:MAG: hypothetical protein RIR70_975, partial [Pseudomonadota bacterium]
MQRKIIVVDDDTKLRTLLTRYLTDQGFAVKAVGDAEMLDRALLRDRFDLLVLDLMLPDEDGVSICKRLRAGNDISNRMPILMLTARGADEERIKGLNAGADDYLPKPFNPRELLARIEAILRRAPPASPAPLGQGEVCFGPNRLNLATRSLTRDGVAVPLTSQEFALLK